MPVLPANPSIGAAGRPQPQTPEGVSGGPWIRYSRSATRPGFAPSGALNFGQGPVTNPIPSAPGYLIRHPLLLEATGGNHASATAFQPDAPANAVGLVQYKDPWGTPVKTGDGFSILDLEARYSGQMGVLGAADRTQLPSHFLQTAAGAGSGNFRYHTGIPVEGTKGYGVISVGNASVMPTVLLQPTTASSVYSTPPTTLPSITPTFDLEYYDIDPSNPVVPTGNGTTFQSVVVQGNQSIGRGSSTRVQLPRTGGYLTTLVLILRDLGNNGQRVDAWNSGGRIRQYIDGVPRYDDTFHQLEDRMYEVFQTTRPVGVMCYTYKDSLARLQLGLLDTLEVAMQTNPGTLVEEEMTPWGSAGTGPYQLSALQIQSVPAGVIAQGLTEA